MVRKSPRKQSSATAQTDVTTVAVVGIGTSAGGLASLETFLRNVPERSGVAYAIVQHQDPDHQSMLPPLLKRATSMPVVQIDDLAPVEADCVYIIPPNKNLTLKQNLFHLTEPAEARGLRLPIDNFFMSLAKALADRAIGVVLSGMGTDGSLGLRAIKKRGGKAFVQNPQMAKFSGMPASAIAAGVADVVADLEDLPGHILRSLVDAPARTVAQASPEALEEGAFQRVNSLLRAQTGHDFSLYKKSTLLRRMRRRMALHKISLLAEYADYLRDNPQEAALLFNECLIGVTQFFRDPSSWDKLAAELIERLSKSPPDDPHLRAWVAGCSTGEEAYSLAIVFKEVIRQLPQANFQLQIFATDIDSNAVNKARMGHFPKEALEHIPQARRDRYFVGDKDGFRAATDIREMIIFAPQTVITDPPFTKLDILCCRNLLIYFSVQLQERLIQMFHYSLNAAGVLFLGSSETVGAFSNLFVPIDDTLRMYKRRATNHSLESLVLPQSLTTTQTMQSQGKAKTKSPSATPATLQSLTNQLVLRDHCPTTILASPQGSVLYTSGRPGKYLEPASGAANWNIFVMARDGLRHELYAAFTKSQRHKRAIKIDELRLDQDGQVTRVNVVVRPLSEPETLRGLVLVVISEIAAPSGTRKGGASARSTPGKIAELQHELMLARESMSSMQMAAQVSQEEYRSANEELQSANEELQSANEEMVTSKEEMQSLNEELHTVNQELELRINDLATANSDMNNLLDNTAVASLFLDVGMCIRRFTPGATHLIKLIPSDVGRPFTDIATEFDYPSLLEDARETMRTLVPSERRITGRAGRRFLVRIDCYRTIQNKVDGVVITFTDISAEDLLAGELESVKAFTGSMTSGLGILSWSYRADASCDRLGPQWLEYTGLSEGEQLARGWLRQVHEDDQSNIIAQAALAKNRDAVTFSLRIRDRQGTYLPFKACSIPEFGASNVLLRWSCWAVRIESPDAT